MQNNNMNMLFKLDLKIVRDKTKSDKEVSWDSKGKLVQVYTIFNLFNLWDGN